MTRIATVICELLVLVIVAIFALIANLFLACGKLIRRAIIWARNALR